MKILMYAMLLGSITNSYATDLTVNITHVLMNQGVVKVALYNRANDFPEGKNRYQGQELRADKENLNIVFKDLAAGRYAIAVMQDSNNNGVLDRNFFGIPTEPYGFSQRPADKKEAMSFEEAALVIDHENKAITIELVN